MRQFIPRVAFALLLAAPATAAAQSGVDPTTLSLEDLMATPVERVYGASKFLQKLSDAPAAITIVTADEIRRHGYRTLADVLRSVEGLSVSYDRNYTYVGIRGLSRPGDLNSRVLVLVDGHRMNNNVDGQAPLGTDFQLDVGLIDRVEVIRGPAAALYGSNAFAAVVAVITRPGSQLDGLEAAFSFGSYDTTQTRAAWGKRYASGLDLLVAGTMLRSDGPSRLFFPEFAAPETNFGVVEHGDGDRADHVAISAGLGTLKVLGLYSERTKTIPTASYSTLFNSGREATTDGRVLVDAQYTTEFGRSSNLLARGYADRHHYDGRYPYAPEPEADGDGPVINRDHFRGVWWGGELALSQRLGRSHVLTAGAEFRRDSRQSTLNYDESPRTVYIDEQPRTYGVAGSVQDEYQVTHRVRLNVSGRIERLPTGDIGFGPKVAAIFAPTSTTTVKALFSRALRSPTMYELYYDSPANAGNPDLDPERMESIELNVEHALSPAMSIDASLYRNTYRDLIVDVPDETGAVGLQNGLDARAPGFEIGWQLRGRNGRSARASYSTLFDADAASRAWTSGAPKHLAKASAAMSPKALGLSIAGELQYESRRHTHTGDVLDPVVVANLNVIRPNLLEGVDLHASVLNAFDAHYSEPVSENHRQGSIAQDGRQIVVGLTWRFK